MQKELIISTTPQETKLAILEDDELVEFYIERHRSQGIVGNIYKGKVTKVLPGMQSAFVDIGLDRDAFLYVSDFFEDTEEYDKIVSTVEEEVAQLQEGGARPQPQPQVQLQPPLPAPIPVHAEPAPETTAPEIRAALPEAAETDRQPVAPSSGQEDYDRRGTTWSRYLLCPNCGKRHDPRNRLLQIGYQREGYWTIHLPDKEEVTIFDAAERYQRDGVPGIVFAGKEYGSGSSRDWAAKGPLLLGVRAVIAESFERIHRSNLVGMGVLPLQFQDGESLKGLGLTGTETFTIRGLAAGLKPGQRVDVEAKADDGSSRRFTAVCRLDNQTDVEYLRHGGVLPMVLRQLMARAA